MDIFKEVCEQFAQRCVEMQDVLKDCQVIVYIYPCYMIPMNCPPTDIIPYFIRFSALPVE